MNRQSNKVCKQFEHLITKTQANTFFNRFSQKVAATVAGVQQEKVLLEILQNLQENSRVSFSIKLQASSMQL